MTEVLTYEALKTKCDALLMENVARGEIIERLIGIFGASGYHAVQNSIDPCSALMYDAMQALKGSGTSAAIAAIEARFCLLLETYEKVEPERFNPEFADLYAKIVNRIFSSAMDNPSVTDLESLTDYLDSSAENARAYADMSMKFHAEQQEAK